MQFHCKYATCVTCKFLGHRMSTWSESDGLMLCSQLKPMSALYPKEHCYEHSDRLDNDRTQSRKDGSSGLEREWEGGVMAHDSSSKDKTPAVQLLSPVTASQVSVLVELAEVTMPQTKRKRAASAEVTSDDGGAEKAGPGSRNRGRKQSTTKTSEQEEYTCWLMKSEPESRMEKGMDMKFGIEDLKAQPNQTACWDGVRNYQARNFMRTMKSGQQAFFYHSNCKEPGIAGIVKIVKQAYVDHTQFDPKNPHYDSSSSQENPKWFMVDVQVVRTLSRFIPLAELKKIHQKHKVSGGALRSMALFTRARLSVQPLTQEEFDFVLSLENETIE
uniref:Thymocyte nuclear protein 1 n=1 Tax=Leptobrachium leishanense TaxID=445787 RepID=A0A8C5MRT8_9ANUR